MSPLRGRVALVTGAGGGLGRELARQLLWAGTDLLLSSHSATRLAAAAEYAARPPARAAGPPGQIRGLVAADLSGAAGCGALAAQAAALAPDLDLLIHNAGVGLYGLVSDIPPAETERLIQLNLLAPLRLTAALLPAMIARRQGQVALISSILGLAGIPGVSVYSAAKFGLRGFGGALAADVERHGLAVTLVYPSFTRTEILAAQQHGPGPRRQVPGWMLDDPPPVVRATLAGIAARRRHVYPSLRARAFAVAAHLAPSILPPLSRLIER